VQGSETLGSEASGIHNNYNIWCRNEITQDASQSTPSLSITSYSFNLISCTFPSRSSYSYSLSLRQKFSIYDCLVNLFFKRVVETFFTKSISLKLTYIIYRYMEDIFCDLTSLLKSMLMGKATDRIKWHNYQRELSVDNIQLAYGGISRIRASYYKDREGKPLHIHVYLSEREMKLPT